MNRRTGGGRMNRRTGGERMNRTTRGDRGPATAVTAATAALLLLSAACGLTSGSPMVDDVSPGTVGRGEPLKGADLTVTSKEFTEQLVLGAIMGIAFEAAGAEVLDRTGIQGSIGAREAVKSGDADAMYEYTGTAWITYLGNSDPVSDPERQWRAVRDADRANGLTWLPAAALNNTYALAMNRANFRERGTKTLSEVAALAKKDPGAVTLCVESEFANRADGLPGMEKAYGMSVPAKNITQMDTGIIYTQVRKGSCAYGEVYTTDGRIRSMNLTVMKDDRAFFPNYNAAPEINSRTLEKWPAITEVLAPVTAKLDNTVAQELNAKVDVEGEDPHQVALDWMKEEGFVK
jgi:osmoprotectant transport system substrate-binding protein